MSRASADKIAAFGRRLDRREADRIAAERIRHLRTVLKAAFAAPEDQYVMLDAETVFARAGAD